MTKITVDNDSNATQTIDVSEHDSVELEVYGEGLLDVLINVTNTSNSSAKLDMTTTFQDDSGAWNTRVILGENVDLRYLGTSNIGTRRQMPGFKLNAGSNLEYHAAVDRSDFQNLFVSFIWAAQGQRS